MPNIEQVGNLGYIAFGTEATTGTAVTPTVFALLEDESLVTDPGHKKQSVVFGNLADTYTVLPGMRKHTGDITVAAEPNTATEVFDMLLPRSTVVVDYTFTVTSANATIGATYTNNGVTFTVLATIASQTTLTASCPGGAPSASGTLTKASGTGDSSITFSAAVVAPSATWSYLAQVSGPTTNSKTIDISVGDLVKRFYGVMASKVTPAWKDNEMTLKVSISALGSFQGATIATATYSSPTTTVVFDTTYDPNPTTGLVVGDSVKFYTPGTYTPTTATIVGVTNGTTITLTGNYSAYTANSSILYLSANASPTFSLLPNFLWTNTQFCFGATASAALSAAQTRLNSGTTWETTYGFSSDAGEQRSGGNDPASLPRTTINCDFTAKKFFHYPDDIQAMQKLTKGAVVIRHFVYFGGTTYEMRVTINHIVASNPLPPIKPKEINYSTIKYDTQYDATDGQMYGITMINNLATIG